MPSRRAQISILIIGDVITLALVTGIGFATHGTLGTAGSRMLTTFVPLLVAWAAVAPFLGVYDPGRAMEPRQLWRPFWAMVLAAPLASLAARRLAECPNPVDICAGFGRIQRPGHPGLAGVVRACLCQAAWSPKGHSWMKLL